MKMFMKTLKNSRGYSMLELIIAGSIIGIAIYSYLEVRQRVTAREKDFKSEFTVMKLLLSLKDQIMEDDEFIVPFPGIDDSRWKNLDASDYRCFDGQGASISHEDAEITLNAIPEGTTGAEVNDEYIKDHPKVDLLAKSVCTYFVTFYKSALEVKGRFAPIGQYHIRMAYFVGGREQRRLKVYTFRPIKTTVLYY